MKIAVTGLSNSGKTTVFNALTGLSVETTVYPTTGGEPHIGVVKVPDPRLERLSEIFKPKKTTPATVEYIDYIGLTKGDMKQNRKVFEFIKDADALLHVVRAFRDEAVAHPLGGVDPRRDAAAFEAELLFGDLELVERRLETMELAAKKGKKQNEAEGKALLKCRKALEGETALRDAEFTGDELKAMRHLQFMSIKPLVVLVNIDEGDLNTERAAGLREAVEGFYADKSSVSVLSLCGKVEMEIAELPPEERRAFLDDLGIEEPALGRLIRVSYGLLGLNSFFTVGGDEVKAWAIEKGTEALAAAGKIHTDIQRGFIRAEVVAYEDFIASGGSMPAAREKGLVRLEGKTYQVRDGDIINFRFNI
jgi:GTP-binding protein YchF